MIHTVKGFGIVNKAEIDVFLELYSFFHDPANVGTLISGSSAFSKTSLNIWKFAVHALLNPGLENFEHYFTSMWDECSCAVVWAFFGIALLGIYPEETRIEKDACTSVFIAALFTISRTWKQPRCSLADEWIRKLWYIYTVEYYSAIKKRECIWVRFNEVDEPRAYYWRRQWHPTPVLLPGKSHGRRSLVGCSAWGRCQSDMTERLHFHALEKEMATHSTVLAWRIPRTGEPGGLPSLGSHGVGHDWSNLAAVAAAEPITQSEVVRKRQIPYINTYIWNLERWYQLSYVQSSKGDTDIKNKLLDSVGEGEGGVIWEYSIETYITICKIDRQLEFDVWCREPKARALDNRGRVGSEGDSEGKGHMYACGQFELMYSRNH